MRSTAFCEFENPLPADLGTGPFAELPNPVDVPRDVFAVPLVVVAIRERDEDRLRPSAAPCEPATRRICCSDDDPPHAPDTPLFVDPRQEPCKRGPTS
jgi:hypothetical protein